MGLPEELVAKKIEGVNVLQQYAEKRNKKLDKAAGRYVDLLEASINHIYEKVMKVPCLSWVDVYNKIGDNLRKRDLTIDLKAPSWFNKPNTYEAYTQMYERAVDRTTGRMALTDDALNPADVRATADDQVTLPKSWAKYPKGTEKRRMYDAMNASGSKLPSQFLSGVPMDKIYEYQFGERSDKSAMKLVNSRLGDPNRGEKAGQQYNSFDSVNRKFNPYAKQVFAALNYGQRSNGSSTQYGHSHLVLKSELKRKCLYYIGDTFYLSTELNKNTPKNRELKERLEKAGRSLPDMQSSYEWLGHVMLWANEILAIPIFYSCYLGLPQSNTSKAMYLLEAHVFSDVRFNRDVECLVLAQEKPASSPDEWQEIQKNAYAWAKHNNCRVIIRSAP